MTRLLHKLFLTASVSLGAANSMAAGLDGNVAILYTFTGGQDGGFPYGSLAADSFGNLYGSTFNAGANGTGTLYKIDDEGGIRTIYQFPASTGLVVQQLAVINQTLYGTAHGGTETFGPYGESFGVLFSIKPDGSDFTVLHNFDGIDGYVDGLTNGPVVEEPGGGLAGVASAGGDHNFGYGDPGGSDGVVYLYQPSGKLVVLHNFTGNPDGENPNSLVRDAQGNLFGSTPLGGPGCSTDRFGCGVIFELTRQPRTFKVIYAFTGGADCQNPILGSIDSTGTLYGVTENGCATAPHGIDFALTPTNGTYQFTNISPVRTTVKGAFPWSGPVPGPESSLIGTTYDTIYAVRDGQFYFNDFGAYDVYGPVVVSHAGSAYGTCQYGTCGNYGAIFRFKLTKPTN